MYARLRPLAIALACCAVAATAAEAQQKFLDGAYGNKDGCLYAKTDESTGSDDFFLLKDDGITTAVSYCEFKGAVTKTAIGFAATVSCGDEGDPEVQDEKVEIVRSGDAYTIKFEDGTTWGPLPKCR